MSDYIFVPRSKDFSHAGGFDLTEVVSHEFFPKGYKYPWSDEGRAEALLKVNIRQREQLLCFYGLVAEEMYAQIEEKLQQKG